MHLSHSIYVYRIADDAFQVRQLSIQKKFSGSFTPVGFPDIFSTRKIPISDLPKNILMKRFCDKMNLCILYK